MPRAVLARLLLLAIAAGLGGCAGSTYTIEDATLGLANERAARYCGERDADARFEGVRRHGDGEIEVYRCVPR